MTLVDPKWIDKHKGQYADWHPTIEITRPGSRQTITIKSEKAEKAAIQSMKRVK